MKINNDTMQSANVMFKQLSINQDVTTQGGDEIKSIDTTDFSSGGKAALDLADDMGIDLSQEDAEIIDKFMKEAPGTAEEKLAALKTVLQKNMPIDDNVVSDVHTSRSVSMVDYVNDTKVRSAHHRKKDKASAEDILRKMTRHMDDDLAKLLKAITQNDEGSAFSNEAVDDKFIEAMMTELMGAMIEIPTTDRALDANDSTTDEMMVRAETLMSTKKAQMVLETTITPKLAAVKNEFNDFKTEMTKTLNDIITPEQPMTAQQKSDALSRLIDKVDSAIMKSEIGMYVDIKSERDLLRQSSKLSDARVALLAGDLDKAESTVKVVLTTIEKMTFNPTIQKAVAIGNPLNVGAEDLRYKDIATWAKNGMQQFSNAQKSPALLVNYLRKMGINHEAEVFQKVFGQLNQQKAEMPIKDLQNLKSMLLELGKEGESKDRAQTEKLLSHINGQQAQLKVEDKPQPQPLLLNIPVQLNSMVSDVKVFIKTKQDDLKADWRNFSMFFVLDTKRFGDVGIKVSSVDTHMRIDIKSDRKDAETVIRPLSKQLKSYVEDVGFTVTGLKFSGFGNEHPNMQKTSVKTSRHIKGYTSSEKGFDFQI